MRVKCNTSLSPHYGVLGPSNNISEDGLPTSETNELLWTLGYRTKPWWLELHWECCYTIFPASSESQERSIRMNNYLGFGDLLGCLMWMIELWIGRLNCVKKWNCLKWTTGNLWIFCGKSTRAMNSTQFSSSAPSWYVLKQAIKPAIVNK